MQPSRSIKSHTRHTCMPLPVHTSTVAPLHPPSTSHFPNSLSPSLSIKTRTHTRHMAEESRLPSGSSGRLCLGGVGGGDSANTTPPFNTVHTHKPYAQSLQRPPRHRPPRPTAPSVRALLIQSAHIHMQIGRGAL